MITHNRPIMAGSWHNNTIGNYNESILHVGYILCDNSYGDWLQHSDIWYAQTRYAQQHNVKRLLTTIQSKYEQQRRNILCDNQMIEMILDWGTRGCT